MKVVRWRAKVALLPLWIPALVVAGGGCQRADSQIQRTEAPRGHVDSVIPRDVELARFREGLSDPAGLSGGAESRDRLVRRFVTALERRDSVALAALTLTRAEFAYLYYPTSPEAAPPYDLGPSLMWFTLQQGSRTGLLHALDERGGRTLNYVGYVCEGERQEGENTVWGPCLIRRLQAGGDTIAERLFGPIIERGGRYKFVSLSNSL